MRRKVQVLLYCCEFVACLALALREGIYSLFNLFQGCIAGAERDNGITDSGAFCTEWAEKRNLCRLS